MVVSSFSGSSIVVWVDDREGSGAFDQVYAQRLDANGVAQWAANGIRVSDLRFHHGHPNAVPDRFGGAFIVYAQAVEPGVDRDMVMQHVDVSGNVLWGNGVILGGDPGDEQPALVQDGNISPFASPGAIAAWADFPPMGGKEPGDILAGKVDADGSVAWGPVGVCTVAGTQFQPAMVRDGVGTALVGQGVIIAWTDLRGSQAGDIYAQHLSNTGVPQWGTNGRAICTAANAQDGPALALSAAGSPIIAWRDDRSGNYDIYAQLENNSGAVWTANGVPVCTAAGNQFGLQMIPDSKSGALLAWQDLRADGGDIYAQRLRPDGIPLWPANGVPLCTAANVQQSPVIVTDIASGFIVAWSDRRLGAADDIFAQRADSSGIALWNPDGMPVCRAAGLQSEPSIAADGTSGGFIAWTDNRSVPSGSDIYANHVTSGGGVTSVDRRDGMGLRVLASWPNPGTGPMTLRFALPAPSLVTARVFGVDGRAVRTLLRDRACDAGVEAVRWDGADDAGRCVAGGIYWVRVEARGEVAAGRIALLR